MSTLCRPAVRAPVASCLVLIATLAIGVRAAEPPATTMQRAEGRLDAFLDEAWRTGRQRFDALEPAVAELESARVGFERDGARLDAARCRLTTGRILRLLDRPDAALRELEAAAGIAREVDDAAVLGRALVSMALTRFITQRDFEGAEASIAEAVRVGATLEDRSILFEALSLRAEIEQARGALAAAAGSVELALELEPDDPALRFRGRINRSSIYLDLAGRTDVTLGNRARMAAIALADAEHAARLARELGRPFIAERCDEMVKAARLRVQEVALRTSDPTRSIELDVFNPTRAEDVVLSGTWIHGGGTDLPPGMLTLVRTWESADVSAPVRAYVRAGLASLAGETDEAFAAYLRAVEGLEGHYADLADAQTRGALLEARIDYYYWPMLMLLERGRIDEAYELLEASRSRVLMDLVTTRDHVDLADDASRARYERLRELRGRLAGGAETADLEREHAALLAEIRTHDAGLLELVTTRSVPLDTVRATATARGYDVLEYLVLHSSVVVWHIGPSGVHLRNVFIPGSQLGRKIETLRETLVDPNVAPDAALSRQLFLFLVQPVLDELTTDRLVIIPHGPLYGLPFAVLEDPADGRVLLDRFEVAYAPSAGILERLDGTGNLAGARILAVAGPDLELAPAETDAIAARYAGSKTVDGDEATEVLVGRMAGLYDVLHVAAHGAFDERRPMRSYVQLASRGADDGRLTAAEMFALPLTGTRLVSLAACESGRTGGTHAGAMLGLPRALVYAGAKSVLLTHWKVDSSATLAWMDRFYDAATREPPAAAARSASRALRADGAFAHPYYWGAFYLVGR